MSPSKYIKNAPKWRILRRVDLMKSGTDAGWWRWPQNCALDQIHYVSLPQFSKSISLLVIFIIKIVPQEHKIVHILSMTELGHQLIAKMDTTLYGNINWIHSIFPYGSLVYLTINWKAFYFDIPGAKLLQIDKMTHISSISSWNSKIGCINELRMSKFTRNEYPYTICP